MRRNAKILSLNAVLLVILAAVLYSCGGGGYGGGGGMMAVAPGAFSLSSPADMAVGGRSYADVDVGLLRQMQRTIGCKRILRVLF